MPPFQKNNLLNTITEEEHRDLVPDISPLSKVIGTIKGIFRKPARMFISKTRYYLTLKSSHEL